MCCAHKRKGRDIISNSFYFWFFSFFCGNPWSFNHDRHASGSHLPNIEPHWNSPQEPKAPTMHATTFIPSSLSKRDLCIARTRTQQKRLVRATHQDFYGHLGPKPGARLITLLNPRQKFKEREPAKQNARKHLPAACTTTASTPGVHQTGWVVLFFWRWGYNFCFSFILFNFFIIFFSLIFLNSN